MALAAGSISAGVMSYICVRHVQGSCKTLVLQDLVHGESL